MHKEVEKFIQYIEDNTHLKHGITQMSIDDFSDFAKTLGFSFTIDEFVSTMKEIDNNTYQNNVELSDEDLNRISAGKGPDIYLETLHLYRNFYV